MYSEIGSEFWDRGDGVNTSLKNIPDWLDWGVENRFLATGRTALDHIIRDIQSTQLFQRAYLPSYCCQTMIEPFLSHNIEVEFYDVAKLKTVIGMSPELEDILISYSKYKI